MIVGIFVWRLGGIRWFIFPILDTQLLNGAKVTAVADRPKFVVSEATTVTDLPRFVVNRESENSSVFITEDISEELVRLTQEKLTALGYDPGPVDGVAGNKTVDAVRSFQRDKGYFADGIINSDLLEKL